MLLNIEIPILFFLSIEIPTLSFQTLEFLPYPLNIGILTLSC